MRLIPGILSNSRSDEYSSDSRKFFEKCIGKEIYVPALVVAEALTVLSKQGMKNAAKLFITPSGFLKH